MKRCKAERAVVNIGSLLTLEPGSGAGPLGIVERAALAFAGERIVYAGPEEKLRDAVELPAAGSILDADGRVALPGLVDCHTHLVFAGSRAGEFAARVSGKSYEEILAAGGGIHSTVEATRRASESELLALARRRLDRFISFGVTTVEAKSGYGLDLENELKLLRVARALRGQHPVDVVSTFLGAHTVPREYRERREAYLELLVHEVLPRVAAEKLAVSCDVFCERGAFTLEETRRILEAGLRLGLPARLHAEQLSRSGSIALAVELGALSVDHLEFIDESDARLLSGSRTTAVILPAATLFAGKQRYAPGRMLCDTGCRVAVSTDFNPGSSHTQNLPMTLTLACLGCRLTPEEAVRGATRHAAAALGLESDRGSIGPGKRADVLILDSPDWRDLLYHFGGNLAWRVFKNGQEVLVSR
ncbi:MAG: imidazolonepropionase [Myxococcales bacterium]|nr:imidazolonepropionase [Myxococcales bacterium]